MTEKNDFIPQEVINIAMQKLAEAGLQISNPSEIGVGQGSRVVLSGAKSIEQINDSTGAVIGSAIQEGPQFSVQLLNTLGGNVVFLPLIENTSESRSQRTPEPFRNFIDAVDFICSTYVSLTRID